MNGNRSSGDFHIWSECLNPTSKDEVTARMSICISMYASLSISIYLYWKGREGFFYFERIQFAMGIEPTKKITNDMDGKKILRDFQIWSDCLNATSTAKVIPRMARGLSMTVTIYIEKGD